jgi:hypothetical protein
MKPILFSLLLLYCCTGEFGQRNHQQVYLRIDENGSSVYTTLQDFIEANDEDVVAELYHRLTQLKLGDKIPVYNVGDMEYGSPTLIVRISVKEYKDQL